MPEVIKPIRIKLHEITSPIASELESVKELGRGIRHHWRMANQSFLMDATKVDVITPRWWQWYFDEWMKTEDLGLQVPVTQWLFRDEYEVECTHLSLCGIWLNNPLKRNGTWRFPYAVTGQIPAWDKPRLIGRLERSVRRACNYVLDNGRGTARDLVREYGVSGNTANMAFNNALKSGLLGFVIETKPHSTYYVYTPPTADIRAFNGKHELRKRHRERFIPTPQ